MQTEALAQLIRPKSRPLLSTSTDREELIALKICISCRTYPAVVDCIHCRHCGNRLAMADRRALAGILGELAGHRRRSGQAAE